jgi:HemK-like putative methylase
LIPRPETEHWVSRIAEFLSPTAQQPISLLDLGTGSGCIPLLLCHLWPPGSTNAHAVDISPHALRLAQDNAVLCGIPSHSYDPKNPENTFNASIANFLSNDFLSSISGINPSFDIITSNPPYIPWKEYLDLPQSVSQFEDPRALFGGPNGFDFYYAIAHLVSNNKTLLKPNALVALEVGHNQARMVERLMRNTGRFSFTDIWTDPWGKQRTVLARI